MDFGFIPLDHLLDDATVQIHRTDGLLADEVYLPSSSLTFTSKMGMLPSKLATPNAENVETSDFASPSDLLFLAYLQTDKSQSQIPEINWHSCGHYR